MSLKVTADQIAGALGQSNRHITRRASTEGWMYVLEKAQGGKRKTFPLLSLPEAVRTPVMAHLAKLDFAAAATRTAHAAGAEEGAKLNITAAIDARAASDARQLGLAKFAQLPEAHKRRAEARAALIELAARYVQSAGMAKSRGETLFCIEYSAGRIEVPEWVRTDRPGCSPGSLQNWRRELTNEGYARLAGNYGKHRIGQGFIDSRQDLRDLVVGMMVQHPHCTAAHVQRAIRARLPEEMQPVYRTLQRWMAEYRDSNKQALLAIANPDAWRSKYQTAAGRADEHIIRLNQRWETDSTKGDLLLSDGKRHNIVGIIDVYSRRLKLHVSRSSSATAVASCLRRALMDWGVCEVLASDNGSDFVSHYIDRIVTGLKLGRDIAPPFTPEHKPFIERAFGTFCRDLIELLPGYIGHDVAGRKAIESRKSFADRLMRKSGEKVAELRMSPEHLQDFCNQWTDNIYALSEHSTIGCKPAEKAAAWTAPVARIADERALDVLLAPAPGSGSGGGEGLRTVGKKGVKIDGAFFLAPELGGREGSEVRVLMDEADIGEAYIFDIDGVFIAKALCPERTGISRREIAIAQRVHQKSFLKEAKARLRHLAKQQKTGNIAAEILESARDASSKIAFFLTPSVEYTTDALREAGIAAEHAAAPQSPKPQSLARARVHADGPQQPAQIINLNAQRDPAQIEMENKERRFARWKAIGVALAAGEDVSPADRNWHKNYSRDAECTSRVKGERMIAEGLVG